MVFGEDPGLRQMLLTLNPLARADGESVRWVSPQLGCDWLKDVRLSGDLALGRGNVPQTGGWEPFSVSVIDGSTTTRWKPDA